MRAVRGWLDATRGTVGVAFALALVPLCGVLGLAIDYLAASNLRNALQGVTDAAALAAGAQGSSEEADVKSTVSLYIDVNLPPRAKAALGAVRVTISKPANIRIEADAVSPNTFLRLVGIDQTPVAVISEAVMGNGLEVALVLDNTGSMKKDGKEPALRQAVRELVDSVMAEQADVKVAVVPFSQYVNVGVENRNAPWLKVGTIQASETWTGCVRSRPLPLDESDRRPQTPYPILAQQASLPANYFCPGPLTPLTADKSVVMSAANAMVMNGNTYIPAGLMWGWNVLTPEPPFTQARASGVRKAMVLMTDGENSVSNFAFGYHDHTDIAAAVRTMLTLCSNIKQAGIHLYTVAFAISAADQAVIGELRQCASDSASAFTADDGTALTKTFRDIAKQLQVLRLAR